MSHFPVQNCANASLRVVEKISGSVVAVHNGDFLSGRWRGAVQPANGGARNRLRLPLIFVDDALPALCFVLPTAFARPFQVAEPDLVRVGRRNAPEDGKELLTHLLAIGTIGIGQQDGCHGTVLDLSHDDEGATGGAVLVP